MLLHTLTQVAHFVAQEGGDMYDSGGGDAANNAAATGGVFAFLGAYFLFIIILYLVGGFILGSVFKKAGEPLWAGFVPIYNYMVIAKIQGKEIWWGLLPLIPCVGFVFAFILLFGLAEPFGKSAGFGIGLIFLSLIFLAILAFGSAEYRGPGVAAAGAVPPYPGGGYPPAPGGYPPQAPGYPPQAPPPPPEQPGGYPPPPQYPQQ